MKTTIISFAALFLFILVVACGETNTTVDEPTDDILAPEETTTEANTALAEVTDEERIAELDKWKKFIETNSGELLKVSQHKYACEGWGGMLSFTLDNDKLRAIEHLSGGDDGAATTKYYYDETDALVLVWHQTSMWLGDDNTTVQMTYYIRDGAVFKATKLEAKGTSATIEANIAAAVAKDASADAFAELKTAANELMGLSGDQVQAHFCN